MLLIVASFLFYWYEWRPTNIRSACDTEAVEKAIKKLTEGRWENSKEQKFVKDDYEFYYKKCLSSQGLK